MKKRMDLKLKLALCTLSLFAAGIESSVFAAHETGVVETVGKPVSKSTSSILNDFFKKTESAKPLKKPLFDEESHEESKNNLSP